MRVISEVEPQNYDIIICDEVQDFTANQIRAVKNHVAEISSLTFIVDTAQRIYARGFTWAETGITIMPNNSFRLGRNYRNTKQIAAFASSLVEGIPTDSDFTIPDFNSAANEGSQPILIEGRFNNQVEYAINFIKHDVDLSCESVAFLHPKGRGWFKHLEIKLKASNLNYIDITRLEDWPEGEENIALSTLHSSKGLEFDHVIILGLSNECMPAILEDHSDQRLIQSRKLLAMGVGRAKKTVIIGYKPDDKSEIIALFNPATYQVHTL
nr:3'-5' exonuclease [Neptunomonas japonica]